MDLALGYLEVAVGVGLLALGALFGRYLWGGDERLALRVRELEADLERERERRESYEDAVARHFGETSGLFRDLTRQYRALYAHLAGASRELCVERQAALGRGFEGAGLPAGDAPERTPETAPAQPTEAPDALRESPSVRA